MKNWTVRKLLSVGFAAPMSVILILAGSFFYSLAAIDRNVASIAQDNIPGIVLSNRALEDALQYRVLTMQHIISSDPAEMKAIDEKCNAIAEKSLATLKEYENTIVQAEDRRLYELIGPAFEAYRTVAREVRQLSADRKEADAVVLIKTRGAPAFAAYAEAVGNVVQYNAQAAEGSTKAITTTMTRSRTLAGVLSVGAFALALTAGFFITRTVNGTIRRVSNMLDETSAQVTSASGEVSSASQSLAQGASEQAASLEETSASIEELSSMTKRNAESAQQTKELSNQTRVAADTCAEDMQAMNTAMDEIKTSSSDISKIIKTIDEIAFQTNILALNAAVEAARAGEAGMGFAVVAEEVRSLAQRSAQSAKETAAKIEVAISKSEHGVRISGKVAESLGQIVDKARKVDTLVAEIATASQEQSQGIAQVNTTVGQMDKVTQSNAGNAEETAAAAEELSAQAVAMQDAVADLRRLIDGGHPTKATTPTTTAKATAPATPRHGKPATRPPSSNGLRRPTLAGAHGSAPHRGQEDLHFADASDHHG
ncbi:MAG TPA: methyl-accepting chemotaxis protein [Opitutus sp.]|nr:methyl-accepting chemotaxis protein [Opitutus sp.]